MPLRPSARFSQPDLPTVILGAAIWFTHRANIARLIKGEEPKSSFAKKTMERDLSPRERRDWLRLSLSENVGPATFKSLIARYGDAAAALAALPELSRKGGLSRPLRTLWRNGCRSRS